MTRMQDKFRSDVEKTFGVASSHREVVDAIKKHASENPELLATRIVEVVPERLKEARTVGLKVFEIDLADPAAVRGFKTSSVVEWQIVSWLGNRHQIYSAFLRLVLKYAADSNLTGVRSAQAVCEAFIEAVERHLYAVALDFDELRRNLPEESFPGEELAKILSGIVATRISLRHNPPLRKAIDERRRYSRGKSAKRERFDQLLEELPGQVLDVWQEATHPLGSLFGIRTEVARRLDSRSSEPSVEVQLATFVDREKILKLARDAGLPPREFELFRLRIENPGITHREAAQRMGIAEGTAKSLWSRTKKTLGAA